MELNYFKDKLFDLLNESDGLGIADLNTEDRKNLFTVTTEDGSVFELVCREATEKEDGWKNAN